MSASVLFDVPGPRARLRNRLIGAATIVLVLASLVFVYRRFDAAGQLEDIRWRQLRIPAVRQELWRGYVATLKAASLATVLALGWGVVFAAGRISDRRVLRWPATAVVELFRAVPLLILIFFWYYGPLQLGHAVPTLWALVLGLTLYNGSVLAEVFRAGLDAVPRGQAEAAYALGMRKTRVVVSILLPQAVRAMLPSIVSQLVVLLKDTALGFIITYPELLSVGKQIGGRLAYGLPYLPTYLVVAAIYVLTCSALSASAGLLARLSRRSKKSTVVDVKVPGVVLPR